MKCKQAQNLIGAYIFGDLAPDEMRDLRVHAQDCALCREDLTSRGRIVSALDDTVPELTDEERLRIAWSVKGAVRKEQYQRKPFALRLIPTIGIAGVLITGIFLGRYMVDRHHASPHKIAKAHASGPSVKIEELPPADTSANPNQIANQISDLLQALTNPSTGTLMPNRESMPSRELQRPMMIPPENPFSMTEGHHVQATPTQEPPAQLKSPEPPKDSAPAVNNNESGTDLEAMQLPRVTDPKSAETTPSENQ